MYVLGKRQDELAQSYILLKLTSIWLKSFLFNVMNEWEILSLNILADVSRQEISYFLTNPLDIDGNKKASKMTTHSGLRLF